MDMYATVEELLEVVLGHEFPWSLKSSMTLLARATSSLLDRQMIVSWESVFIVSCQQ